MRCRSPLALPSKLVMDGEVGGAIIHRIFGRDTTGLEQRIDLERGGQAKGETDFFCGKDIFLIPLQHQIF